jgi:DNA-binding CsgD family transcriptional regulator
LLGVLFHFHLALGREAPSDFSLQESDGLVQFDVSRRGRGMKIEELLPALAPPRGASADATGELVDNASEAMRTLRDLVHCSAFLLSSWDPLSNNHRHKTLVTDGYSDDTLSHVNDDYVYENPAFSVSHTRSSRSLRWCDYERDWKIHFQETATAQKFLIPAGFREGTTVCLRLPSGRYTGALHMSWDTSAAATDRRRDIIERFCPTLAVACDLLRVPQLLAGAINLNAFALVISSNGIAHDLPGRAAGSYLGEGGALRGFLVESIRCLRSPRFLWADEVGCCHRVTLTVCPGGLTLVTEEPAPWPFYLSLREIQVLNLIASGASNPQIAQRLGISSRTASTHVEHLLTKLHCSTRAKLAAVTVVEGLLLPDTNNYRNPRKSRLRNSHSSSNTLKNIP